MHLHSSYTLNSDLPKNPAIRKTLVTGLWIVFFLLVFDFAVNILYPYPTNPQATPPGQLNTYFEYGRSVEGKLSRMVGSTDDSSSSLAVAGWLDPQLWEKLDLPVRPQPNQDLLVAIYGQSFSNNIGDQMKAMDSKLGIRAIAAPAAPPNYSYAAYNLDRGRHQADVVILGVLASSVKGLRTMNGSTWQFEAPAPYTYPRYVVDKGKLKEISPKIQSLSQLRAALQNGEDWNEAVNQLKKHDQFFNPFLFENNGLDNSATVRLIRRAWAQRHQAAVTNQVHDKNGFNQEIDVPVLSAIAKEFSASAKTDGKLPIVLLINDQGYDDHLFQALKPTLESHSVPYISSHSIAPATDLKNFVGDGHFIESADKAIAKAVLELINTNFERGERAVSVSNKAASPVP